MPRRYRKLRGDTAYYPFAARTGLRARQRRHARLLRVLGTAALALAAVLLVLTNWVKLTKKWHPIVFIGLSAAVGVVFRFGGV